MPLAPVHLLGGVVAARPPFSVVLTLWVSMTAALGLASLTIPLVPLLVVSGLPI